jgi:hypothetical protein
MKKISLQSLTGLPKFSVGYSRSIFCVSHFNSLITSKCLKFSFGLQFAPVPSVSINCIQIPSFIYELKLQTNNSLHGCTRGKISSYNRLYIGRHSWLNAFKNFRKLCPHVLLCCLTIWTCNKRRERVPDNILARFSFRSWSTEMCS